MSESLWFHPRKKSEAFPIRVAEEGVDKAGDKVRICEEGKKEKGE